ncbi:MAG TPA: carboxyl transferase domain-containing protein, partial [Parachlamydiaceae bacterium]|nr:carboxyl transferase domain-containing protein [Parachlamydiaceae bacterium]
MKDKKSLKELTEELLKEEAILKQGGGKSGQERQKALGRLTVRERLNLLFDKPESFFEIGIFEAFEMYQEWGGLPAAGVVVGIGPVSHKMCMVIANDATV